MIMAAGVLAPGVMAQPDITGTLQLYQGQYSYDVGGEFTAVSSPSLLGPYEGITGTPAVQTANGSQGFQTFCVQTAVDFNPGNTYTYVAASLTTVGSPQNNLPLTAGVAWLYGEFAQGKLNGYDFNTGNDPTDAAARKADAGLLQAAIWGLMGEAEYNDGAYTTPTTANNVFYKDALNYFGSLSAADASVTSSDYGLYDVGILNLSDSSGSAQNQLVWLGGGTGYDNQEPAPDGGTTLALLGLSLAGLAVFSRRLGGVQRVL